MKLINTEVSMKLYDIPKGSKLLLPIHDGQKDGEVTLEMCTFHHLDGAYSVIETPEGDVVHLGAAASLKKVNDHYELEQL